MTDQPEFDLPPPLPRATPTAGRRGFGGFTPGQLLLGAALVTALVWSMWVTRALVHARQDRIVSARLSGIVGEFVSAEARSASPPAQVEAEMKAFMSGLDRELQRRSAGGEVVLVGEAVLTRNVPDITESLKRAVFASGVPFPRQAPAVDPQRLQTSGPAMPTFPVQAGPPAAIAPGAGVGGGMGVPAATPLAGTAAGGAPSAPRVATFGGQNGDSGN